MNIPKTMKAAILVEQKKPLVIADIELPNELKPGQVLVKIDFSGICGSQIGEIDGAKGPDRFLPHLLGHEGSGTVIEIGPGVKHVKSGNKVVLHWRKGLGIEAEPPSYSWDGKQVNAGWITTFNEYAIVSENRLTVIPDNSDMEVAALFGCAVTTGFGVVVNNAKLTIGESIVIFGAGGVGLSIIQASSLVSAWPIIAVDLYDNRLYLAEEMGASHLINSRKEDARQRIQDILGEQGLDVFIDNTGIPEIIEMGYEITLPQGRVILVGVPRKGNDISIYSLPIHFGKVLKGSHGGETIPHEDIPRYQRLYKEGKLDLKPLVTDRFVLSEINDVIDGMKLGKIAGRCLIQYELNYHHG